MRPIGNGQDRQITVGIDIGSSTITCAIGMVIHESKRVKLLGIASTPSALVPLIKPNANIVSGLR